MNDDDTERCAVAALQLRDRLESLSREVDRAALFERAPEVEQLKRWADALERCTDAAIRMGGSSTTRSRRNRRPRTRPRCWQMPHRAPSNCYSSRLANASVRFWQLPHFCYGIQSNPISK